MSFQVEERGRRKVSRGRNHPLGASLTPEGVNFALYSRHARAVYLCLYDAPTGPASDVIRLERGSKWIWHGLVHGLRAGQLYAYRVDGDWDPSQGHRFNAAKLLCDPYAKALSGKHRSRENLLLGYDPLSPHRDLAPDPRDNADLVPKGIVVDDADFDWQGVRPPEHPLEELVVYEVHVKGMTAHPSSGVKHPGSYLGFVEKIPHLKRLGVNAVELLPIHEIFIEDFLRERGLTNYWGYSTLGFLAPESTYSTQRSPGCAVAELKTMVRELHRAGIEVILDVVYNHTGEGSELGPTLSLKGIDNASYYMLTGPLGQPGRYYMNYTGCGNCVDLASPPAMRLVMDSLRYWVEAMHIDGFRFDLASVLGREDGRFHGSSAFFDAVAQDPVLCRAKLIAEPWDLGTYQVGNFPVDWSEWNGRFRDTLRKFGKGDAGQLRELGWRLTGSADLYGDDGRSAFNSVNFITCHDGFTLHDLYAYNGKHNEANLEENRDGCDDNHSWNCGVEGPTDDPEVLRLRRQLCKNQICHLLFSLGTPMLLGGDELLRSQRGNNNGYCQDNELSWIDWRDAERNRDFVEFVRKAIAFNRRHTILHRRKFHSGELGKNQVPDLSWHGPDGSSPFGDPEARVIGYQLDGSEEPSELGDYRLYLILNADHRLHWMPVPPLDGGKRWYRVIDTALGAGADFAPPGEEVLLEPADHYLANPRSTVVLIGR
jgi:glycogen operon protein